jgi:hypothetical protein
MGWDSLPRQARALPSGVGGGTSPPPPAPATSSASIETNKRNALAVEPQALAHGTRRRERESQGAQTADLGDVEGVHDDGGDEGGAGGGERALRHPELLVRRGRRRRLRRGGGRGGGATGEIDPRGSGGHPGGERAPGEAGHGA